MNFENKIVLVTGGTRGIGRSIAEKFYAKGANVTIIYNSSEAEAKRLKEKGIAVIKCDISNREEVKKCREEFERRFNRLDILVNNAGIMYLFPFENFDEEKYKRMIEVNLNGTIYVTLEFLNLLKRSISPCIINLASNAGIGTALEGTTYYAITKAGIIILTKRLAFELGKYGIRVNAVAPGWVETDLTTMGRSIDEVERIKEMLRNRTSLKTTGKPDDIAGLVLFLASGEARYITGQIIVADGGRIDNLTHSV
ncbi:MAG TPA: SDR family oxidoreductase [Geobacterales bacterium]|nr:SDR family oxidoreductase [Geobacterales bacterium]